MRIIGKNSGGEGGKKLSIVAIYGFVFTMDLGLDSVHWETRCRIPIGNLILILGGQWMGKTKARYAIKIF